MEGIQEFCQLFILLYLCCENFPTELSQIAGLSDQTLPHIPYRPRT